MGKTLLILLGAAGCAHMSDYERCRLGASFEQNPTARAIQMGNCEEVANRESIERMHDNDAAERRREREDEETAELVRKANAPSVPRPTPAAPLPACVASEDSILFPSLDGARALVAATEAEVSRADFEALVMKTGAVAIEEGTRCSISGAPKMRTLFPVVILEGSHVGESGWMVLDQAPTDHGNPYGVHAAP